MYDDPAYFKAYIRVTPNHVTFTDSKNMTGMLKGLAKLKKYKHPNNTTAHPPPYQILFKFSQFSIFYPKWLRKTTHVIWMFGIFLTLQHP